MLQRVVRLLSSAVQPVVVVAATGQQLPRLSQPVIVAHDKRDQRGPLEGVSAGLAAISPYAEAAFVTSCDVPLIEPALVRRMIDLLEDYEIAVPLEGEFPHPLAAVYRVNVLDRIDSLLQSNRLRPAFLFDLAKTRRVPVDQLRDVDPQLDTLRNLNHPNDYFAALAAAGLEPDPEIRAQLLKAWGT